MAYATFMEDRQEIKDQNNLLKVIFNCLNIFKKQLNSMKIYILIICLMENWLLINILINKKLNILYLIH